MERITWQTLEFQPKKKSVDWFWAVSIAIVAGGIISIIYGNFLFAVFLILAGVLTFFFSIKKPDTLSVEVNETGVQVNEILYPFKNIKAFWIEDDDVEQKLLLLLSRPIMPLVVIPMENVTLEELADFLIEYIPAEEMEEPLSHKLMDRIGF